MCKHLFSPVYTTSRIPRIRGGICIIERKSIFECARLPFLVVLLFFICHPKMYSFSVCNSWEGRGMLNKFVATNINATRYVYFCYTWIAWWRVPSTFPHFTLSLLLQVTFTEFPFCSQLRFVFLFGRACFSRCVFNAFYSLTFTWKTQLKVL